MSACPTHLFLRRAMAAHHDPTGRRVVPGPMEYEADQPDKALHLLHEARDLQDKLVRFNPTVSVFQRDLARTYNNIGNVQRKIRYLQRKAGNRQQAPDHSQKARDIQAKLVLANPGVTQYQSALAGSYNNLDIVLRELDRSKGAAAGR